MRRVIPSLWVLLFCTSMCSAIELSTPNFLFHGVSKQILISNPKRMLVGQLTSILDMNRAEEGIVIRHNSSMPPKQFYDLKLKMLSRNGEFLGEIPASLKLFPAPSVLVVKQGSDYLLLEFYRDYTLVHHDGSFGMVAMDQKTIKPDADDGK